MQQGTSKRVGASATHGAAIRQLVEIDCSVGDEGEEEEEELLPAVYGCVQHVETCPRRKMSKNRLLASKIEARKRKGLQSHRISVTCYAIYSHTF